MDDRMKIQTMIAGLYIPYNIVKNKLTASISSGDITFTFNDDNKLVELSNCSYDRPDGLVVVEDISGNGNHLKHGINNEKE